MSSLRTLAENRSLEITELGCAGALTPPTLDIYIYIYMCVCVCPQPAKKELRKQCFCGRVTLPTDPSLPGVYICIYVYVNMCIYRQTSHQHFTGYSPAHD